MTEQDMKIQELRRENEKLRAKLYAATSDLSEILTNCELCRYCKYVDGDCNPRSGHCVPVWRGL